MLIVSTEILSKPISLCTKKIECIMNVSGRESFQREYPIIPGCSIDKYKTAACSTNCNSVAESDVNIDLVKVTVLCVVDGLVVVGFTNGGVIVKGEGGFSSVNVMAFLSCLD